MSRGQKIFGFFLFILCFSLSTQCSDELTAPREDELFLTNEEAVDIEIAELAAGGIQLEECIGVFSIGWNQWFRPRHQDAQIVGESFGIGFSTPTSPESPFSQQGVDMGTVYLNCPDKQIELIRRVCQRACRRGGIVYTSFSRPFRETGSVVDFYPDLSYQFEVTGSPQFDPLTFSLLSPSALIAITSHVRGESIDPDEDFTITWEGGYEEGPINIFFIARPHRRHRGPRETRPDEGVLEVLETNTGTYTLPASKLQELLGSTPGSALVVRVSQVHVSEIDHGGERILGIVRNGDGVILGGR